MSSTKIKEKDAKKQEINKTLISLIDHIFQSTFTSPLKLITQIN